MIQRDIETLMALDPIGTTIEVLREILIEEVPSIHRILRRGMLIGVMKMMKNQQTPVALMTNQATLIS